MFSDFLVAHYDKIEKIGSGPPSGPKEFLGLLEKSAAGQALEMDEIVALLNSVPEPNNSRSLLDFSMSLERPHRREILLLPPLYFSSVCENCCRYCDFSPNGVRLSPREFSDELAALLQTGYRSIELVSSQDPALYLRQAGFSLDDQKFDIRPVLEYVDIAKKCLAEYGGGMLTSNIPPLDRESLRKLKMAELDCYLIWQETFDAAQYGLLHGNGGPKKSQKFRLDSVEYALAAGIDHVAGAFLKGLFDWRKEEACLYLFDRHLKKNWGHGFSIIGTPRLKGKFIRSKQIRRYHVSDIDYELNIALDRVLYDGVLWLQTREPFALNRRLLKRFGGGLILTITCSTAPGGYHKTFNAKAQFPVFRRKLSSSLTSLEEDGFIVRFDWDSKTLKEFQRKG
jgi:2-iminoacetate synthase